VAFERSPGRRLRRDAVQSRQQLVQRTELGCELRLLGYELVPGRADVTEHSRGPTS
jgi:hypothetical protein